MPEQPQWPERTLNMPPQDPWAEHPTAPPESHPHTRQFEPDFQTTQPAAPQPTQVHQPTQAQPPTQAQQPPQSPFSQGRASVAPRDQQQQRHVAGHEPTGTGWPGAEPPAAHRGMSWKWSELRRGNEWSGAAALFAFVCWGIWAISEGGSLSTAAIVLFISMAVAVGVFCLSRVVGYYVLERSLGRERRTARGSHLVTALFLAGVGIAHLQMTGWVMTAWNWVAGQV